MFDTLAYGVSVAVLGMTVVFSALAVLMFVIRVVAGFFAPKTAQEAPRETVQESGSEDGRLIAAIAAALAVCLEDDGRRYAITSVRKREGEAWKIAGRNRVIAAHGLLRSR